jgi:hypothetical protein
LIIRCVAAFAAVLTLGIIVLSLPLGDVPQFFHGRRLPLGRVDGIVPGENVVFVASGSTGRIYKFDLNGNLLDWTDIQGRPIRIFRHGESMMVHYSGREWPLEGPEYDLGDRQRTPSVTLENTWWGDPVLLVSRNDETSRVSLQPWYLTALQYPWPGWLYPVFLIVFCLVERWANAKRKGQARRQMSTPSNSIPWGNQAHQIPGDGTRGRTPNTTMPDA